MTKQESKRPAATRTWLKRLLPFMLLGAGYFLNVELQSYLGRNAQAATGLEDLTLTAAMERASEEDKLVLVDLSAIWCANCRRLDNQVFANADVQAAIHERFVFARVDYESAEGKAFQERYAVRGFPVLLVLRADGSLLEQLPIVMDADAFRSRLRSVDAS